jgi:hypothetical protein
MNMGQQFSTLWRHNQLHTLSLEEKRTGSVGTQLALLIRGDALTTSSRYQQIKVLERKCNHFVTKEDE